jgi:MFS family permease
MQTQLSTSSESQLRGLAVGLWSICWRLWLLLPFLVGAIILGFLNRWWFALACAVGFVIVVCVMRHFWPASDPDERPNRPCDIYL